MRDDDQSQTALLAQPVEQGEDLGLDGDIESRRRLVGNHQIRIACQSHGEKDPLLHAAGEFVGIAIEQGGGIGQLEFAKQGDGTLPGLPGPGPSVSSHDRRDLAANREERVESGGRILMDHRDVPATQSGPGIRASGYQVLAPVGDRAAGNRSRRRHEAENGVGRHRLATSRLADNAVGRALLNLEIDSAQHQAAPLGGGKIHPETGDGEERCAHAPCMARPRGLVAMCTASPARLNAMMVRKSATPGNVGTHQWPVCT